MITWKKADRQSILRQLISDWLPLFKQFKPTINLNFTAFSSKSNGENALQEKLLAKTKIIIFEWKL